VSDLLATGMILSAVGLSAFVMLLARNYAPPIKRVPPEQAIIREIVAADVGREGERESDRDRHREGENRHRRIRWRGCVGHPPERDECRPIERLGGDGARDADHEEDTDQEAPGRRDRPVEPLPEGRPDIERHVRRILGKSGKTFRPGDADRRNTDTD
jgi:hypothetical protein